LHAGKRLSGGLPVDLAGWAAPNLRPVARNAPKAIAARSRRPEAAAMTAAPVYQAPRWRSLKQGTMLLRIDNHFPVMLGSRRPTRPTHNDPCSPGRSYLGRGYCFAPCLPFPAYLSLAIRYPVIRPLVGIGFVALIVLGI